MTITSSNALCLPSLLTAGPTTGISNYVWNGPISGTGLTLNANLAGTYVVTGTANNGCQASTNINFTGGPLLVSSSQNGCDLVATLSGGTPPFTYNWSGPNSFSTSTINPTVTPGVGAYSGTYKVVISDANGCTAIASVNYTSQIACCSPGLLPSNEIFSTLTDITTFYGGNTISNQTFAIDANISIDDNVTFAGCHIYMAPEIEIVVDPTYAVVFDDCIIEAACNTMWKGMDISAGSVNIGNSAIRDMQYGFRVSGVGSLNSTGNDYENNWRSISLNDLTLTNSSSVNNDKFKTLATNLKFPRDYTAYGDFALGITNCKDLSFAGCQFERYRIGAFIHQNDPSLGISTHTTSGNRFKDIQGYSNPTAPNGGSGYFPPHGVALSFENHTQHNSKLIHKGNNDATVIDFDDCRLGILANNVSTEIEENQMFDVDYCVRIYRPENHLTKVLNNVMNGTYTGVLLLGNPSGGGITGNIINLNHASGLSVPVYYPNSIPIPQTSGGIRVSCYSKLHLASIALFNNTISTTDNEAAYGISLRNAYGTRVEDNVINFNSTTAYTGSYPLPSLLGFKNSNCRFVKFEENIAHAVGSGGNPDPNGASNMSAGFYNHRSTNMSFDCNLIDYTQFGMYVVGDNRGNYNSIGNNRFAASKSGILYRHLVDDGTLGNIGIDQPSPNPLKWDGNNKFPLLTGSNPAHKVRRVTISCASNPQDEINTDVSNLTSSNASSIDALLNTGTCLVQVFNPSFAQNEKADCGVTDTVNSIMSPDGEIIDHAEDVAQDGVVYTQYPEGGEDMDERELYAMLDADPSLRNGRPILDSFYLEHQQDAMAQLHEVDMLIAEITGQNVIKTSTFYTNTLAAAKQLNSQIVSDEVFETNERWVNTIYLNMLTDGWVGYTQAEHDGIITLAADCFYLGGFGVYKARTLAMEFIPNAHYDDLWICNTMGVYKGGVNRFDEENKLLNNASTSTVSSKTISEYEIYPNPTQGTVQIRYTGSEEVDKMTFTLYDLIGNKILVKEGLSNYSYISIPPTANGIYTYTITNGNEIVKRDKLLIER